MYIITEIINLILKSIFVGFSFIIPLLIFIKTSNLKALSLKDVFILTSVQIVRIASIMYVIIAIIGFCLYYFNGTSYLHSNVDNMTYILYTLVSPVVYFLLSQLLWIKKMYMNKILLIIFCVLMIVMPSRIFLDIAQTIAVPYNDYLPSSWKIYTYGFYINPVLEIVLNVVVFIFIVSTIILLTGKFKNKNHNYGY